jgi:septal ring factor EnvC (AmiA/AmiB activator)
MGKLLGSFWLALFAVLSVAVQPGYSEEAKSVIYASELTGLIGISTRLAEQNQTLSREVSNLMTNFGALSNRLTISGTEVSNLGIELATWRSNSEGLSRQLTLSEEQSAALTDSLVTAESNFNALQKSFGEYTNAVCKRMADLEFQRNVGVGVGILGIVGGIVIGFLF